MMRMERLEHRKFALIVFTDGSFVIGDTHHECLMVALKEKGHITEMQVIGYYEIDLEYQVIQIFVAHPTEERDFFCNKRAEFWENIIKDYPMNTVING
jgi:hypothetical protein